MTKPNDGGPAFPMSDIGIHGFYGMTLRDWFAGQALQTLDYNAHSDADLAKKAVSLADAMIAALEAGK